MSLSRNTLLLVQTGTPPDEIVSDHGDLPLWFGNLLAPWRKISVARVYAGEPLPAPDNATIAVITGSWDMVTERLPWSEMTAAWIREAMAIEMPLFGVCYGHQLMAHALGVRWTTIQPDAKPGVKPFRCPHTAWRIVCWLTTRCRSARTSRICKRSPDYRQGRRCWLRRSTILTRLYATARMPFLRSFIRRSPRRLPAR